MGRRALCRHEGIGGDSRSGCEQDPSDQGYCCKVVLDIDDHIQAEELGHFFWKQRPVQHFSLHESNLLVGLICRIVTGKG